MSPPAIPAVIAAASAYSAGFVVFGYTIVSAGIGAAFAAGLSSLALGAVSSSLGGGSKGGGAGGGTFNNIRNQGITRQLNQPIIERGQLYGEVRSSGGIALITSTNDNEYLHMVVLLASHEVAEIGEIFVDDVSITDDMLDGSGMVTSGRYDGLMRIKKHLGTVAQAADSDLVSEVADWTSSHKLTNIAYIYVRMKWDRDVFPNGIPNFSAWIKGKKVLDPRDSVTRWSPNTALICRDYLADIRFGLQVANADILDSSTNAAANTCEEFVTTTSIADSISSADPATDIITLTGLNGRLQYQTGDRVQLTGGGLPAGLSAATNYYVIVYQRKDVVRIKLATSLANALAGTAINITLTGSGTITKNAEPRYFGGASVKSNAERGKNLQELMTGMAGQAIYAGGSWSLLAGEYQTPTEYYGVGDLASSLNVITKVSRRDRFNTTTGVYISPINDGNPADYPVIKNATYISNDNGEILRKTLDLPVTQRPHTAQRLAKIDLERARQEIVFTATFKLNAFRLSVGDNFFFTSAKHGWTNKVFEVIEWAFTVEGGQLGVQITARENASDVYDWNNGEETSVDPAKNSDLPSPFNVSPPTGLSVTPIEIGTQQGDLTYEFKLAWTPPADAFVINGGHYDVQFRRSTDIDWNTSFRAEDDDSDIIIKQVQPAINYDVRIRAVNSLGVRSSWQQLLGFNMSSPSGATVTLDYGLISNEVVDTLDYGLITDAATTFVDYEGII